MNENEHSSQLSALFDGELPAEQSDLVIRRAMKDPQLRVTWGRYALIGAAMRSEPLAIHNRLRDDVAARVGARLSMDSPAAAAETRAARSRAGAGGGFQFARGAWGMAIAASVAAISLIVLRNQSPQGDPQVLAASVTAPAATAPAAATAAGPAEIIVAPSDQAAPLMAAANSPPRSYTTPVDDSVGAARIDAPLVKYVVAHSDVSASVVRFSPLSSVMSAGTDLTQGTVEMTEAEIGAHR